MPANPDLKMVCYKLSPSTVMCKMTQPHAPKLSWKGGYTRSFNDHLSNELNVLTLKFHIEKNRDQSCSINHGVNWLMLDHFLNMQRVPIGAVTLFPLELLYVNALGFSSSGYRICHRTLYRFLS